jgi:pyruvate dehydrogenase E1 component beta subunit
MSERQLSMAEAIREAIRHEMHRDSNLMLMGQDIGPYGGTFGVYRGLIEEFGADRVHDCPLCEAATAGFGVGMAISGMPTIVEVGFMDFITLSMDAIVNQAAKMRYFFGGNVQVPFIVRTPVSNRRGLGAQHSQSLEAWFMHIPGLHVVAPSNATDAKGLLISAIRGGNPTIFMENVRLYATKASVDEADEPIPFGKLRVAREGTDVTIVTYSAMVRPALEAAANLANEGIECEVLDLRTLAPLDGDSICSSVRKTGRMVVVHEAVRTCGAGAEIAQVALEGAFDYLQAPIQRVTSKDLPIPTGPLENEVFPRVSDVEMAVRTVMK